LIHFYKRKNGGEPGQQQQEAAAGPGPSGRGRRHHEGQRREGAGEGQQVVRAGPAGGQPPGGGQPVPDSGNQTEAEVLVAESQVHDYHRRHCGGHSADHHHIRLQRWQ